MKIAVYCHNYEPHLGGVEIVVRELARAQVLAGHEVSVVSTAWQGTRGESMEDGVRVMRLPAIHASERLGIPYPIPTGRLPAEIKKVLASADVHHAHGCLYRTTTMAARMAGRFNRPLVVTEHVGFVPYPHRLVELIETAAWRLIGDRILANAAVVVTLNQRVKSWLEARDERKKVRVIPNGVDLETFRPVTARERAASRERLGLPRDEILGLFAGRVVAKKNLETLLDRRRDAFRLVVCGTERQLPDDVVNLGILPHEKMADVFGAVDFLIHLGIGEGFPIALQEASASGLPAVILWDEGYEPSMTRSDAVAINDLDEVSEACSRLAGDSFLRSQLGARARRCAEANWSWGRAQKQYDRVYAYALDAHAAKPTHPTHDSM